MERIIADGLSAAGIAFVHATEDTVGLPITQNFDFFLPDWGVFIECKQFHSERSVRQLSRASNVILVQGVGAARAFVGMLLKENGS